MDSIAGRVASVNTRMTRIPRIVKFTKWTIGTISEKENDSNPAAVVMPVMVAEQGHRKLVRHYDEPDHFHELTFSRYRHMLLLTNDVWQAMLGVSIDRAQGA